LVKITPDKTKEREILLLINVYKKCTSYPHHAASPKTEPADHELS